jgi:hypothetical protein
MILALAAMVATGIVLPHVLSLQRVTPVTAIVLWLNALALRALADVLAVIYALFFLPRTELFVTLTHWCAHAPIPFIAANLDVEGHGLAKVALYLPGLALAASLLYICVCTARDAHAARQLIEQAVGRGPRNSLILGGPHVLFAVAGLARPRIVVSAGALASLDDEELAAGLNHEQGHIARRHRFLMLLAMGCRALGRVIPGSDRGVSQLAFHLERDADRWALRQRNDRLALASVICKAAVTESARTRAPTGLGNTGARERLGELLDDTPLLGAGAARAALGALTTMMVICTLVLGAIVPAAAVAGAAGDAHRGHHRHHCDHS